MYLAFDSLNAQITPTIDQVTVNGVSISNCSTINFGSNNTATVTYRMKITKLSSTVISDFEIGRAHV